MKRIFLLTCLLALVAVNFTSCSDDDNEKEPEKGSVYGPWQVINLDADGLSRFLVFDINGEMKCIDAVYGEGNKLVNVQVTDGFFKIENDQLTTTLFGGQTFNLSVDKHSLMLKNAKSNITCTKVTQNMIDELLKWKPADVASLVGEAWLFNIEEIGNYQMFTYHVYKDNGTFREYLYWLENGKFSSCEYKEYNWKIEGGNYYMKETSAKSFGAGQTCIVTQTKLFLDDEEVAKRVPITPAMQNAFDNATVAV